MREPQSVVAYRRKAFLAALIRLRVNKPPTAADREILFLTGMDLLKGHDTARLLGVTPKKGPRETHATAHAEIAFHCYSLHLRAPGMLLKRAAGIVAEHWGIPDKRIEKIVRERSESAKRAVTQDVDGKRLEACEWHALIFRAENSRPPVSR